ncbi:Hypothetical predicted protein [Podarcis lilfordi]|uniref:Uncharacterized protein n=1 Tax=Podarcis lilfordi TaxID=74358 RepID=A0AA35NVD1_9SAUR|nr:Hypothetical predicted protein [Podarcis lilfordi]
MVCSFLQKQGRLLSFWKDINASLNHMLITTAWVGGKVARAGPAGKTFLKIVPHNECRRRPPSPSFLFLGHHMAVATIVGLSHMCTYTHTHTHTHTHTTSFLGGLDNSSASFPTVPSL